MGKILRYCLQNILIAVIFVLFIPYIQAQDQAKFERITTDKGLSEGFVNWILKDHNGFVWFATRDGLNRFDGYSYEIFKNDFSNPLSISSNVAQVLLETRDSVLFIGTHGGLNVYNYETGSFKSYKNIPDDETSLSNNAVYSLYEDRFGKIWVGTFGGGVCVFDRKTEKFKRYMNDPKMPGSLSGNAIRGIVEDKKGDLWVGVDGAGLNKFDRSNNSFKHFRYEANNPKSLGSDIVLCIKPDSKGNFWVGSWASGVTIFDPIKGEAIRYLRMDPQNSNSLASNENFSIVEASTGDMWITTRNGLDKFNLKTGIYSHYQHDPLIETSINFNVLCFVYEDRDGILWVGTEGGGAAKLDLYKKPFQHLENNYKLKNSLSNNDVTAIFQDNNGKYWIGTREGLNVFDYETNTFVRIYNDPANRKSLISNQLQSIAQDVEGYIWFGASDKGLSRYNPTTGEFQNYSTIEGDITSINNNAIYSILSDRYGYMWFGTYGGGINRFDLKTRTFKPYLIDAKNNMQNVALVLFEDTDDDLWCGSMGHGLLRYNRSADKFINYEVDFKNVNSISSNIIYSIHEADGYLWIGTGGGGLNRFDKQKNEFKCYKQKEGLASDQVLSILSDDSGNLWIGTAKGMSRFTIKNEHFRNFDSRDGLSSNSFNANSAFRDTKGNMIFGSKRGFTMFNADSIFDNKIKPSVVITDFKVFNESVIPGDDAPIKVQISEAKTVEIHYSQNNFTFEFAALHFSNSEKNRYKYKMEGYDEGWTETDFSRRYATYTNLPGGTYTFTVIASNNDGVWNDVGVSLSVEIIPPFWKTFWFYILIACVIGFWIYMFIRYREKQAIVEKQLLENQVAKAVGEVEEQKKEILQQNSALQEKQKEDEQRRWFNEGIARFGDILRNNKNDIPKLGHDILSNLVRYIDAVQAGMFVISDDFNQNNILELVASYAYDSKHFDRTKIEKGEGLVGNCFIEKRMRVYDNIPDNYLQISSSLGSSKAHYLILVPLRFDETVYGVLEISTFKKMQEFEIQFLEKLAENITAQLFNTKMAIQTQYLLTQSQKQTQDLKEHEEEIRQNIEEMQANQEEMLRETQGVRSNFESINNAIIRCQLNQLGRIEEANVNFFNYTGLKYESLSTQKVQSFFKGNEFDISSQWKDLLKDPKPIVGQLFSLEKNRECPAVLSPVIVNNELRSVLVLALDVTLL